LITSFCLIGADRPTQQRLAIRDRIRQLEEDLMQLTHRVDILERSLLLELAIIKEYIGLAPVTTGVIEADLVGAEFKVPLSLGQVAHLGSDQRMKVLEVVDERNLIVDFVLLEPQRGVPSGRILAPGYSQIVCVSGVATAGLTDGATIKPDATLKVVGTTSYLTAIGDRQTVFLLQSVAVASE